MLASRALGGRSLALAARDGRAIAAAGEFTIIAAARFAMPGLSLFGTGFRLNAARAD